MPSCRSTSSAIASTRAATAEARAAASGLTDPADDLAALERARHARQHLLPDRRVRALDRDNVGTVISLHDTTGDATVLFVADDGTPAVRTLAWSDLKPIDHPEPVDITPDAQQWLDREAHRIVQSAELWATALADYSIEPGEAGLLRRAIQTRRELLARQMHADSPDWLTWWVGTRPIDPAGATVWDDTVSTIAAWRDLHHVTAEQPGLGVAPTEPNERQHWLDAMATTLAQRSWLSDRDAHPTQVSGPTLTPVEIHDRISQLDQIFADAPTDHSRIIDDLIAGHLTTPDLHAALTEARSSADRARSLDPGELAPHRRAPRTPPTRRTTRPPRPLAHPDQANSRSRPRQARRPTRPRPASGGPDARRAPRSDRRARPRGAAARPHLSSSSPSTTASITSRPTAPPRPTRTERRSSPRSSRLFEPTSTMSAP